MRYTFLSNHNIHKRSCGLCFLAPDPLINRFYPTLLIKGSWAKKQRPIEFLWMLWFDKNVYIYLQKSILRVTFTKNLFTFFNAPYFAVVIFEMYGSFICICRYFFSFFYMTHILKTDVFVCLLNFLSFFKPVNLTPTYIFLEIIAD